MRRRGIGLGLAVVLTASLAGGAPTVSRGGKFVVLQEGSVRTTLSPVAVDAVYRDGEQLLGPMFLHFRAGDWKTVGSEMAPVANGECEVRTEGETAAVASWTVIGGAREDPGRWKVSRTVRVGPGPLMHVEYDVETLAKSEKAYYLYVSVRMPRRHYRGAKVSVRAKQRVGHKDGKRQTFPAPESGVFELGKFGGLFRGPRALTLAPAALGNWSMRAETPVPSLGLSAPSWTCEAQWVTPNIRKMERRRFAFSFDFSGKAPASGSVQRAAAGGITSLALKRPAAILSSPARRIAADQRAEVCLNGDWPFLPGGTDEIPADDAPWIRHHVPGGWRSGEYDLTNSGLERPYLWSKDGRFGQYLKATSGWYRFDVALPRGWDDDRRVTFEFEGVGGTSDLCLDGKRVAHSDSRQIPVVIPLDDVLKVGRFTLLARVQFAREGDFRGKYPIGIWKDVFLRSRPRVEVRNVFVMPSVRRKQLTVRAWVANTDARPHDVCVAPSVWLGEERVLALPAVSARVTPGEVREISTSVPWQDPLLWGFEPYGRPVLYTCRTEIREEGQTLDARDDRFGFREFWTQGREFYLNGRPIFLKGDLTSPLSDLVHNRWLLALFYLKERGANLNFIRVHTRSDFPHRLWLDVADEVGMLIEPQSYLRRQTPARYELLKREWDSFVRRNWNHPSVVMWSSDNEAASQAHGLAPEDVFKKLDEVHGIIRGLDPTRPVESQGNVQLGVAKKMGLFRHLEVFSPHPYGSPLGNSMKQLLARYECPADVPIHVGEIYLGYHDPFNWWTRPAEMLRRKAAMTLSYENQGRGYHDCIRSVAEAGARGASLCAGGGRLYWGPTAEGDFCLGPWHDLVKITDESYDRRVHAAGAGVVGRAVNTVFLRIKWPSRSGLGARPDLQRAYIGHVGRGEEFNFWDAARPASVENVAYHWVRKAFEAVDGQTTGPLAERRAPEVVATLHVGGKPVAGAYVFARRLGSTWRQPSGVMTDRDGTAWMALREPGEYELSTWAAGRQIVRKARLDAPRLDDRPGYLHIAWLDLVEPVSERLRARLAEPTQAVIRDKVAQRVPGPDELGLPKIGLGPYRPDRQGFLRTFLVCGPFPNVGDREKGFEGLNTDWLAAAGGETSVEPTSGMSHAVTFPEGKYWTQGNARVNWTGLQSDGSLFTLGRILLPERGIAISPPHHVVNYAACTVVSPRGEQVVLAVGSDDGHIAWLNGKRIGEYPTHGGAKKDAHKYPVRLRQGENRLLLEVDQSYGGYGFYCRFLRGEAPVKDLTLYLSPHPIRYGPRPLTTEGGAEPTFSPDGERLAFSVFTEKGPRVYVMDVTGETGGGDVAPAELCAGFDPSWSPKGDAIVFCRSVGEKTQLWSVNPNTRQEEPLTELDGKCQSPAFSPNGRTLYFAFRSEKATGLCALDLAGRKIRTLTDGSERAPAPSPDGERLAFVAASGPDVSCLSVLDLATGKRRQLTKGGSNQGGATAPAWSPDGKWIAYTWTSIQPQRDIYLIPPDGGKRVPLTDDQKDNTQPCWAPDGERLVIVSRRGTGNRDLWLLPAPHQGK